MLNIENQIFHYKNHLFYAHPTPNPDVYLIYNDDQNWAIRIKALGIIFGTILMTIGRLAATAFDTMNVWNQSREDENLKGRFREMMEERKEYAWLVAKLFIPMEAYAFYCLVNPKVGRYHYGMCEAKINGHYDHIMDIVENGGMMKPLGKRFKESEYLAGCFQPIVTTNAKNRDLRLDRYIYCNPHFNLENLC